MRLIRVHRPQLTTVLFCCAILSTLSAHSQSKVSTNPRSASLLALSHPKNGIETFDAVWKIIHETHWDTNFNGVDWIAVRAELRPEAQAAGSMEEIRAVIEDMLSRLGQSHMALIPGQVADVLDADQAKASPPKSRSSAAEKRRSSSRRGKSADGKESKQPAKNDAADREGDVGFDVRLVDGSIVVFRVDPGGPAVKAGVQTGWIVRRVGSESMAERLEKLSASALPRQAQFMGWRLAKTLLMGAPGSTAKIEFLDAHDRSVTLKIQRGQPRGQPVKLGLLPNLFAQFDREKLLSPQGAKIGLIRFNLWMIPIAAALDRAVDEFRSEDGIIIDLRGNLGGVGGMIMGVSGHFLNDRISLGTMTMRGNSIQFFTNPRLVNAEGRRVEPFAGPVAILVDGVSLSAAEIFAGSMQDIGRARVFGETSPGQALPAVWDRLPNGDVLYHAIADYVTASGVRLEGRGVVPDEEQRLSRADLLAGRDAPLAAALEWITKSRTNPQRLERPASATKPLSTPAASR